MIERITLRPSSGGRFEVTLDGELIFSKHALDRHAKPGEIHALVHSRLGPPIVEDETFGTSPDLAVPSRAERSKQDRSRGS